MDSKALIKLEYNKIVEKLIEHCGSQLGKDIARELVPSTNIEEINVWQSITGEAVEILRFHPNVPLGGIRDIRRQVRKLAIGGVLEPTELLEVLDTLQASRRLKTFFNSKEVKGTPLLKDQALGLMEQKNLEEAISKVVGNDGEIKDDASPELSRIRKQIRVSQSRIKEKLDGYVRSSEMQKYLQDSVITIRGDRYVLPVKQEYRQQVPGLVHDTSSSGATLFIEPMAIVELNNELKRYQSMEKTEVIKVLTELSAKLAEFRGEFEETVETLGEFDFSFAKGKFSQRLDCIAPKLNTLGKVNIKRGRHPLIKKEEVVPSTIFLGDTFDTLVITGPNTGGKTVTLKTVGLLTAMGQSGLHVPADVGTELNVFDGIYVDIGDEQSIEQSLSTFSSHLNNIISILDKVNYNSLVLMDELGAGTDPTEGSALAMAILDHLYKLGAKTIATTHYSELKTYAYSRERVENASVEFDVESLRPTYRLLIGVPGKSNAFEISKRLGLKTDIIEVAKSFLTTEDIQVSDLIENLEVNQLRTEQEKAAAERIRIQAEIKLKELQSRELSLQTRIADITRKAELEALEIIKEARIQSDNILKEVREAKLTQSQNAIQKKRDELRNKEGELSAKVMKAKVIDSGRIPEKLKVGDQVFVPKLNQKAYVMTLPNANKELQVQAGIMKITVKINEIQLVDDDKKETIKTGGSTIAANKAKDISNEFDLRGMTVDEATIEVDKYLDDAFLAGVSQVYLIHGKGTGVLRSAIRDLIRSHSQVKSSRSGGYHEGGSGVTVVEFKK